MLLLDFEVKYSDHTLSSHCVCVGGLLICAYICGWTTEPVLPQQHSAATACTIALHPRLVGHEGPQPLYRPQHIAPVCRITGKLLKFTSILGLQTKLSYFGFYLELS